VRLRLGASSLWVSPWCFGCNLFGWTADERQSFRVLDAYVAHGGNFLDTADVYPPGTSGGTSEEILGRWLQLRRNRHRIVLATKVGGPTPGVPGELGPASVRKRFQASLRRLKVDHVDLLYAHLDDRNVPLEESLGALDDLVQAGQVRHIAASNFTAVRLAQAIAVSRQHGLAQYVALQTHYNLLERGKIIGERASLAEAYEGPLAELCTGAGIGVVAYWALAKGFLTGKYRPGDAREAGAEFSDRARMHQPRGYLDARGIAVLGALDDVASAHATNVGAVALAWTLAQPGVTAIVASARTDEQVAQLAAAEELELDGAALARLARASSLPSPDADGDSRASRESPLHAP
jgi:aryl-alcohol dehydrogenase-like predicted oxidoreductase